MPDVEDYRARLTEEVDRFSDVEVVHDLPPIYGYWAVRYCLPLFEELGYSGLEGFYDDEVIAVCNRCAPAPARMVSLGAGNGDIKLGIARRVAERGVENLELVLLELNPTMLEHAYAEAADLGIAGRVSGVEADLNTWRAEGPADIYFASHSLHHVVELEHLFDPVASSSTPAGSCWSTT